MLIVEPFLFGWLTMGETQLNGQFYDRVDPHIGGRLVCRDSVMPGCCMGINTAQLARPAMTASMCAMTTNLYRAPDAPGHLLQLRALFNPTSGRSLLTDTLCVLRLLADDCVALRKMMLPMLNHLTQNTLPRCWRL